MKPIISDDFGHWLSGYLDGEAHFGCLIDRRKGRKGLHKTFIVNARADEYPLLLECQQRTGLGHLYFVNRDGGSNPTWQWCIRKTSECLDLIEILDQFPLRSKKRQDYEIWKRIVYEVSRWKRGGAAISNDHTLVNQLVPELVAIRQYDPQYERVD
jgi:hypothetical protein